MISTISSWPNDSHSVKEKQSGYVKLADVIQHKVSPTSIHYDKPAEFYRAFLDPYLKYSTGLFESDNDSWEKAAVKMLDLHIKQTDRLDKPRILEIGPGWGSFLKRLNDTKNNFEYVAINPSKNQNQYLKEHIDANVEIIENCVENVIFPERKFDFIFFIGSFCHMQQKPALLNKLHSWLDIDGQIIIEETFFLNSRIYERDHLHKHTSFIEGEVFGFSHIISLPFLIETAVEKKFSIGQIKDLTDDHKKTIEGWSSKLISVDNRQYSFTLSVSIRRTPSIFF